MLVSFNMFLVAHKDVCVRYSREPCHFNIAGTDPALFASSVLGTVFLCVQGVVERGCLSATAAPGLCRCY